MHVFVGTVPCGVVSTVPSGPSDRHVPRITSRMSMCRAHSLRWILTTPRRRDALRPAGRASTRSARVPCPKVRAAMSGSMIGRRQCGAVRRTVDVNARSLSLLPLPSSRNYRLDPFVIHQCTHTHLFSFIPVGRQRCPRGLT